MLQLKFMCDKKEVNFGQVLNLLNNFFEVIVWMTKDDDKEGWSVKIKQTIDRKFYYIETETIALKAKSPLEAIQKAITNLLLWVK